MREPRARNVKPHAGFTLPVGSTRWTKRKMPLTAFCSQSGDDLFSVSLVDKVGDLFMNVILLVDKPAGISSAEVVRRVKSRVKPARVGHLGTIDPFATGLLPIMIGEATKLAPFIDGGDKEYAGLIRLGVETDTLDRDGAEVRRADIPAISPENISRVSAEFTGAIEQVPPVYSAIKRAGVPLYRLPRPRGGGAPPAKRSVQ